MSREHKHSPTAQGSDIQCSAVWCRQEWGSTSYEINQRKQTETDEHMQMMSSLVSCMVTLVTSIGKARCPAC